MTGGDKDVNRRKREEMVRSQIAARGVRNDRVLKAMVKVPREKFVREENIGLAFYDGPLSIGCGQTISQPYIVAYMTEVLEVGGRDKVLEVGTGSGYQTAILAELAAEVCTVEIIEELTAGAQKRLSELGYKNIRFRVGDGSDGWPEEAPFDRIMVTAAPGSIPKGLAGQLAEGGSMIVPVGSFEQYLELVTRKGGELLRERLIGVRFVPMTGKWS